MHLFQQKRARGEFLQSNCSIFCSWGVALCRPVVPISAGREALALQTCPFFCCLSPLHSLPCLFYLLWLLQVSQPTGGPARSGLTPCPAPSQHLPSLRCHRSLQSSGSLFLFAVETQNLLFCLEQSLPTQVPPQCLRAHTVPPAPLNCPVLLTAGQTTVSHPQGRTSSLLVDTSGLPHLSEE